MSKIPYELNPRSKYKPGDRVRSRYDGRGPVLEGVVREAFWQREVLEPRASNISYPALLLTDGRIWAERDVIVDMTRLIFDAADVARICEHSIRSAQAAGTMPKVALVHDDGLYLMSNGTPHDNFVAYAKGCNPQTDADWYETSRALVGGDDFTKSMRWARKLQSLVKQGAQEIVINFANKTPTL